MLFAPRVTYVALALFAASAASANDRNEPGEDSKSWAWGLGVAGLSQQQTYTGIDRDNFAVPLIYFENRWVQLMGPWLDLKLPALEVAQDQELSFGLRTQFFGVNGYEPDDAPILDGMEERKEGLLAGAFAKWSNPLVDVSAEWLYDVSGESDGQRIKLGLERSFFVGEHFRLTPSASAVWLDEKFADYYYGVRSGEARAGRPAYLADSTLNLEVGFRTDYMIDPHQTVFLQLEYTALGSEIKDSPLTDRSSETMVLMGYLYRF